MWIYDYKKEQNNPYRHSPFLPITHMCYIDNLPQWNYPYHTHETAFELIFVVQGTGSFDLDNRSIEVLPGSVIVVPPLVLHRLSSSDPVGMRYHTISFDLPEEPNELGDYFTALGIAVTDGSNYLTYIRSTLQMLFNFHQVNGGIVDEAFQSIALGLFQLCKALFTYKALQVRLDEHYSASDILNYIMDCHGCNITLESLAKHFNVSQSHLSRIFCNAYHMSPINYAIHARITYATEYLLKTDLPINEIALRCGYDNPTHFTNLFVKRIGCTPTEYRERNQRTYLDPTDLH